MDNEELDQKLQEALALHDEGKSYSQIRNHFKLDVDDDTISYIIRLVDEFSLEEDRIKAEIKKAKFKMYVGAASFCVSALVLYIFYTKDALKGAMSLLAYLPLIFSIYLLWKGYQDEVALQKSSPEIDDTKFRMKRRGKK